MAPVPISASRHPRVHTIVSLGGGCPDPDKLGRRVPGRRVPRRVDINNALGGGSAAWEAGAPTQTRLGGGSPGGGCPGSSGYYGVPLPIFYPPSNSNTSSIELNQGASKQPQRKKSDGTGPIPSRGSARTILSPRKLRGHHPLTVRGRQVLARDGMKMIYYCPGLGRFSEHVTAIEISVCHAQRHTNVTRN